MEIQEREIEYDNPRNIMDNTNNEVATNLKSFQLLQKPELKFRWLWLLFGIPLIIDLGIYVGQEIQYVQNQYTQNLKKLCLKCQENISKYKRDIDDIFAIKPEAPEDSNGEKIKR